MNSHLLQDFREGTLKASYENLTLFPASHTSHEGTRLLFVRAEGASFLLAYGSGPLLDALQGDLTEGVNIAPANHENRLVLNRFFPYTAPVANVEKRTSMGLGDRLGLATFGHIHALKGTKVFPIFAQQSIRELTMTNRTYEDVIDAAAYAVFAEGYTDGYGADGDHLKSKADILKELSIGATMITLDSSEKIDNTILDLNMEALEEKYQLLSEETRSYYEDKYLNKNTDLPGLSLPIGKEQLMRDVLTYGDSISFIHEVYEEIILPYEAPLDFEISIDETATPTNPISHYIIAKELNDRDIVISTMAPRFIGEFQKGIDYIGDLNAFREDIKAHVAIAEHFGYRISVHSGSDKFSIFPIVAEETHGRFHVKTAGTNWLEAVEVIAEKEPKLYRRLHAHALSRFEDATALYHVTTDLSKVPSLDTVEDKDLPKYLKNDDARQLLHITYGYILEDKNDKGDYLLKNDFFEALEHHLSHYFFHLEEHISKHLRLLSLK